MTGPMEECWGGILNRRREVAGRCWRAVYVRWEAGCIRSRHPVRCRGASTGSWKTTSPFDGCFSCRCGAVELDVCYGTRSLA